MAAHYIAIGLVFMVSSSTAAPVFYDEDPYSSLLSNPYYTPPAERHTNKTIDELMTDSYGGLRGYVSNGLFRRGGRITAELDMTVSPEQYHLLYGTQNEEVEKRKATRPVRFQWTNKTIPYEFIGGQFSPTDVYYIKEAMADWQEATCLTFRPARSADTNRVRIQNGVGCSSSLGMVGGTQNINLQTPHCRQKSIYLHEIGHTIGLLHEHQLPDRGDFLSIIDFNVAPGMHLWLDKYNAQQINQYGVPYDHKSVMQFGVKAFSKDGYSRTMQTVSVIDDTSIGRAWNRSLAFSDIKVVNLMYGCNDHCTTDLTCTGSGYLDRNCQCVCPGGGNDCAESRNTSGGGSVTGSECRNAYNDSVCNVWASVGECDANPNFMTPYCRKACNRCDTSGAGQTGGEGTDSGGAGGGSTVGNGGTTGSGGGGTIEGNGGNGGTTGGNGGTPGGNGGTPSGNGETGGNSGTTGGNGGTTNGNGGTSGGNGGGTTGGNGETGGNSGTTGGNGGTTDGNGGTSGGNGGGTTGGNGETGGNGGATDGNGSVTTAGSSGVQIGGNVGENGGATDAPVTCVNSYGDNQCILWARQYECNRNPVWMAQNCRRACNRCSAITAYCLDRYQNCAYWATVGHCRSSHATFMRTYCRRSCQFC